MTLLCFSHLRWDFVYQRPQHLMSRFAKQYNVYYIEEPVLRTKTDGYELVLTKENVTIVRPHLKDDTEINKTQRLKNIIDAFIKEQQIKNFISWYYSPMALLFTDHIQSRIVVYDCMDELSAFKFAPPELKQSEQNLFKKADVVFTGGYTLYKAKKHLHHNVYAFPSSIEKEHFAKARTGLMEPSDQKDIPYPRLGFFGVIDERFDIDMIEKAATLKPDWHFILIGPVIKISQESLPKNKNIHYPGIKTYDELPTYISGWNIALIPFAINESTKYISPTKTPEYLAAGKPVISTAIQDVIHPYADEELVHIVDSAEALVKAASIELNNTSKEKWLQKADEFLADNSWNSTWKNMFDIVQSALNKTETNKPLKMKTYV